MSFTIFDIKTPTEVVIEIKDAETGLPLCNADGVPYVIRSHGINTDVYERAVKNIPSHLSNRESDARLYAALFTGWEGIELEFNSENVIKLMEAEDMLWLRRQVKEALSVAVLSQKKPPSMPTQQPKAQKKI